ncbi:MAG: HNH endonuclease, partial [Euryarchaeota archaeon]|nr:HNH endonuclease [Euryarchaeota archaeon]
IDHIHPRSKGGERWDASNCTTACRPCNQLKGSMSIEDFHLMIA